MEGEGDRTATGSPGDAVDVSGDRSADPTGAGACPDQSGQANPIDGVLFHATRNAVYHVARRRRLEAYNRAGNFLVVVLGASAAADIAKHFGVTDAVLALAAAVVGALQLTFDFGGRSRTHEILQRRYFDVLAEISESPDPEREHVCRWDAALNRIYGDEPPMLPVGNADAHNDATNALGLDPDERIVVPFRARLLAGIFPFDGADWPTRRMIRTRREERRERWRRFRARWGIRCKR
ncbi:MAG: hypothetical protein DI566_13310 [Microbacterium sp.]|nr:MAG: hypothetical protein DI566_13310 [Microbacterium sp.]